MNQHLGEEDLDHLLARDLGMVAASPDRDVVAHAQSCAVCSGQLHEIRQFAQRLRGLSAPAPAAPLATCPTEDVWLLLAAHIVPPDQVDSLLDHAAQCDACGLLLHAALLDLGLEATDNEIASVASQETSSSAWRADFARHLRDYVAKQIPHPISFWRRLLRSPLLFLLIALVAATAWWTFRALHPSDPGSLLAAAYTERRTIEPRFEGASWAPLDRQQNADGERSQHSLLLKAEAEIAAHLTKNPNDVSWLDASARAKLLENTENSIQSAVATLEKALLLDRDNFHVSIDLASAYLLRSQFFNHSEDASRSALLLSPIVASNPANETAVFNYALALEKLQANQRAIAAWSTFLDRFPSSSWCTEARQHRDALQGQTTDRL